MNYDQAKALTTALKMAVQAPTETQSKDYVMIAEMLAAHMTQEEVELCKQAAKDAISLEAV